MNKKTITPVDNTGNIKDFLEYIKTVDLDDDELIKINRFLHLDVYQQNIIILKSGGQSLRDIGCQFDVSYQWINQHLKDAIRKINSNDL